MRVTGVNEVNGRHQSSNILVQLYGIGKSIVNQIAVGGSESWFRVIMLWEGKL